LPHSSAEYTALTPTFCQERGNECNRDNQQEEEDKKGKVGSLVVWCQIRQVKRQPNRRILQCHKLASNFPDKLSTEPASGLLAGWLVSLDSPSSSGYLQTQTDIFYLIFFHGQFHVGRRKREEQAISF
jgi:hypothetical protein